jgi:hypothetical protein
VRRKRSNKPCVWRGLKLDKKFAGALFGGFAHSILWIFSSLSTKGSETPGFAGLEADLVDVAQVSKSRPCPESEKFFPGQVAAFAAGR